MADFEDAVQELYQVPLPQFIAERKRLADELESDGDAAAAKRLLARKRPTISAWVVNQLYWHARDAFEDLLATAERLRKGDLKASAAHRDAIAKLRVRASTLLKDAGNAPTEGTLRRVTTTLSAIAVAGGFDPDPPGALAEDRDPPGFAAFGISSAMDDGDSAREIPKANVPRKNEPKPKKLEAEKARAAEEAAQRAAEMAEKQAEEAERKRIAAERHRLEAALRSAKTELHDRQGEVKKLDKQLTAAHKSVEDAQEIVDDLERKLDGGN